MAGLIVLALAVLCMTACCGADESQADRKIHPLLVGGHAHAPENIQILHDLGVGNFVWIPKYIIGQDGNIPWHGPTDILNTIDACVRNDMSFMVSQGRGLGVSVRPGGMERGGDCSGLLYPAATITEIKKRAGDLFAGLHVEELDADLIQSALRPGFRTRIPNVYDFTDREGGRLHFEAALTELKNIYQGYGPGIEYWPNLCVTHHHSGFRVGADLVIAELLEHLPTTELQLAYLRGGSHQFGRDWGIWVSPWLAGQVPCEDKDLWPATFAVPGGGHSASSFRRCLYLSYVSGSRVFASQRVEPLFAHKDPSNHDAGYRLAAWGTELKNFWDYAKDHDAVMKPIVSLALMVDKNNGWAPGHMWGDWARYESVWGKLPTDRSDAMLSGYLDVLLPGYGRTTESVRAHTIYPGYFASTPAGPFDIVSSDISAQKLSEYPVVILMGGIDMSRELLGTLRSYVDHGGTLCVNAHQMISHEDFVQDPEFLGAKIGTSSFYVHWVGGHVPGRQIYVSNKIIRKLPLQGVDQEDFTDPWFCSQDVQPTTAEAVAEDEKGNPVLLRNNFGRGLVYLSTPEYMMQGYEDYSKTLGFFAQMICGLAQTGPVSVNAPGTNDSPADISWTAAYQGEGSVVLAVANHGSEPSECEIAWDGSCKSAKVEAGSAQAERTSKAGKPGWVLTLPPEDAVIFRITLQ